MEEKVMNKKIKLLIVTIVMWIAVIIPFTVISIKCIECYKNGINVALEGTKMVFGMSAIWEKLKMYLAFYFPLFVIWGLLFIITVVITVLNRKMIYKLRKKVIED
mgnify:CR=1 FL=1